MTRFILEINLGNDAMQAPGDIATALHQTGKHIQSTWKMDLGKVHDINGNVVGHYEVV